MRVDFDSVLNALSRGGEIADPLKKRIEKIAELEDYTLLAPPFRPSRVKQLIQAAQDPEMLNFRFPRAYLIFMQCCDGGWLFTNQIFSLDDVKDEDNDLITVNMYYRDEQMIPEGTVAIGRTNYGAFIVIRPDGTMGLWDLDEERYVAEYADFYEWLDDVLNEAYFLLKSNDLPRIEDDDEDEETSDD